MASSLRVCRPFAQQAGRAPRATSWATRRPSCFMRASLRVGSAHRYVCALHVVSLVYCTGPVQYSIFILNLPCFWAFPSSEFFLHPARWSLVYFSWFPYGAILFFFHSCPFPRSLLCPFSYLAFSSVVSNFFCAFIVLAVPYRLFPSSHPSRSYPLFRPSWPLLSFVATASPSTSREGVENPQFAAVQSCRLIF